MKKTYYLPTDEHFASVFDREVPVCVDRAEAEFLYTEWYGPYSANNEEGVTFDDLWREATPEEIAEYGVYDS